MNPIQIVVPPPAQSHVTPGDSRADAFAENAPYVPDGCQDDLLPSCFECPLPRCRYDEPNLSAGQIRRWLWREEMRAMADAGDSRAEIARHFGVSERTVYRYLSPGLAIRM